MKLLKPQSEKGQSLVEMAIAAPLLIFFMLGIFEVGAVVRNYLTLVNVNREITRFAVRPGYLDFSSPATVQTSYASVRDWAGTAVGDQLDLDFTDTGDINNTGNTTMIISHFVVETGLPCEDIYSDPDNCDCDAFVDDPSSVTPFTIDDLVLNAQMPGQGYQAKRFGPPETVTGVRETRLDYPALVDELTANNNKFNCEIIKKGGVPSGNNVIVTELFYDQPQLFGFPLISNPYTDPVPLYTHTSMRLIQGARDITSETTGYNVCNAYPFVVHDTTVDWPNDTYLYQDVDIFDGNGGSDFGWLTWDPEKNVGSQSEPFMELQLTYNVSPLNAYTNARDPDDHTLSVDDYVASMQGDKAAVEASAGLVTALIGQKITIPVWDTFDHGTGGEADAYHIVGFAYVMIREYPGAIDLPGKKVIAQYLGESDECSYIE